MIRRRTVLILGAGASAPYGFPVGRKLLMDVVHELGQPTSQLSRILPEDDIDTIYIERFREDLDRSMQPSVDAFLEGRQEFVDLGKIIIAASLIPYEDEAALQRGPETKWYEYLFSQIGPTIEEYTQSARNLSVLTFNYDRSFEHSLYLALKARHGLCPPQALELRRLVRVLHLYGDLGELDYESPEGRPYDPRVNARVARRWAQRIRILHEGQMDDEVFREARAILEPAEGVCFLGFGYHPRNVERLRAGLPANALVYGCAYGLLAGETQVASQLINHQRLQFGNDREDVLLFLRNRGILA
ncbi:MAG: hypothetical protein L0Z46_07820 [Nitrospiraceae bacterium]|nr:hypothetical protein [Nitrospiraceae bacterium]